MLQLGESHLAAGRTRRSLIFVVFRVKDSWAARARDRLSLPDCIQSALLTQGDARLPFEYSSSAVESGGSTDEV